jgi:hypothetical protein
MNATTMTYQEKVDAVATDIMDLITEKLGENSCSDVEALNDIYESIKEKLSIFVEFLED